MSALFFARLQEVQIWDQYGFCSKIKVKSLGSQVSEQSSVSLHLWLKSGSKLTSQVKNSDAYILLLLSRPYFSSFEVSGLQMNSLRPGPACVFCMCVHILVTVSMFLCLFESVRYASALACFGVCQVFTAASGVESCTVHVRHPA